MPVDLPTRQSELLHIFRNVEGQVADTPTHRRLMLEVANDPAARLESDQFGNVWAARSLPDGRQVWVRIRGATIRDAGINQVPRDFNPETGMNRR